MMRFLIILLGLLPLSLHGEGAPPLNAGALSAPAAPKPAAPATTGTFTTTSRKGKTASDDPSLMLELPDVADGGDNGNKKPAKPPAQLLARPKPAPPAAPKLTGPTLEASGNKGTINFGFAPDKDGPALNDEVSIILSENRFYPTKFKLRDGYPTKLFFTTVNHKPGALVIEKLQVQRWIAKEHAPGETEVERAKWETTKEISANRITEIDFEPRVGVYKFHDALSGASGEITVE